MPLLVTRLLSRSLRVGTRAFSTRRIWDAPYQTDASAKYKFSKFINVPKTVAVVGAPLSDGQPIRGVDLGPSVIRDAGLKEKLERDYWKVIDKGDVAISHGTAQSGDSLIAHKSMHVGESNHNIFKRVSACAKDNHFVLTLGGDHSIGVGSIAGILKQRPDVGIIWVDAHADINTPASSISKNIHGMVLSFLMDLEAARSNTNGFQWLNAEGVPILKPERLVYIGLRDLDEAEKNIVKNLNIKAFTMSDIDRYGISKVMELAIDHVTTSSRVERPLHISFDIDSVDPLFAPSTGTRVAGGLTYREAYYICESVAATGLLASMDIVEVNPAINPSQIELTVNMAVGLCASALGNKSI